MADADDVARRKCAEKTAKRNVFHTKAEAKRAASATSRKVGAQINWFRCAACRLWHCGGQTTWEERQARRREERRLADDATGTVSESG